MASFEIWTPLKFGLNDVMHTAPIAVVVQDTRRSSNSCALHRTVQAVRFQTLAVSC